MIPKIMHRCWFGSDIPDWAKYHRDEFLKIHPNWEFNDWTESRIYATDDFDLTKKALETLGHPVIAADICRVEAVAAFGGFYMDTDVEILHGLNFLRRTAESLFITQQHAPHWINLAFFGAVSEEEYLENILLKVGERLPTLNKEDDYCPAMLGSGLWDSIWQDHNRLPAPRVIQPVAKSPNGGPTIGYLIDAKTYHLLGVHKIRLSWKGTKIDQKSILGKCHSEDRFEEERVCNE